jgi:hypothetical protein
MANKPKALAVEEEAVIYFSDEDGCWIAHGLRTDQIGTGERVVDALADLIRAVDEVAQLAAEDESIAVLRSAPDQVLSLAASAQLLPLEVFDVAYKMVHGTWPDNIELTVKNVAEGRFLAHFHEV